MVILENFLDYPDARREEALGAPYQEYDDRGGSFPGVCLTRHAEDVSKLKHLLEWDFSAATCLDFFRVTLEHYKLPTYIHTDEAMAKLTGILYLNKALPVEGAGTKFWRHKVTGLTSMPKDAPPLLRQRLETDGLLEDLWELVSQVEAKYNRLALFDSKLFHSPWPRAGFGTTVQTGRLIQGYFIDGVRKRERLPESIL